MLFVWLGVFSWVASAQPEPPKKTKEELQEIALSAAAAFEARQYQQALDSYSLLYQETQLSDMLFNVAQCQRMLNRYTTSIESYQAYLQDQPASPKRNAIDEVVVEMKEKLAKQAEQQKKIKKRNLLLSGGFLVMSSASGAASLIITREAKAQGNFEGGQRAAALTLAALSDASLLTSGGFLFRVLLPKRPTYTLNLSLTPSQVQAALHF